MTSNKPTEPDIVKYNNFKKNPAKRHKKLFIISDPSNIIVSPSKNVKYTKQHKSCNYIYKRLEAERNDLLTIIHTNNIITKNDAIMMILIG